MRQAQSNHENRNGPNNGEKEIPDLFARTVKGGFWVLSLRIFTRGLEFGQWMVLAWLLEVKEIGLLGIAMLCMRGLNTFSQTGFQAALIQRKERYEDYLNAAWTMGVIRGVVLFAAAYLIAPYAAMVRVPPEKAATATAIIQVIAASFLLEGLVNIGTVAFHKEIEFNKVFALQTCSLLAATGTTIAVAIIYRNVWALVVGKLAGGVVRILLSYAISPYRPKWSWDLQKALGLWRFGKWIFAATILGFLLTEGDDYFVWGYLGLSHLAFYQLAYKFSNIPATEITNVISSVTFPAYSKVQDDIPRMRAAYLKVLQFTAFLSFPVAGLIFVLAPDFVGLFLPQRWQPVVVPMQILAVFGLLRSIGATRGPIYRAVGKPRINLWLHALRLILLCIIIYPLTRLWGITGTAVAVLIENVAGQPVGMYLAMKVIKSRWSEMLKPLACPAVSLALAVAIAQGVRVVLFESPTILSFFALGAIAAAVYLTSIIALDRIYGFGIINLAREQFASIYRRSGCSAPSIADDNKQS